MRPVVRLAIGAATVEAEVLHRGKPIWRGSAEHTGPGDLAVVIAHLAGEGAPLSGKPVVRVELLPPVVQLRTLTGLPPVRERALADLVSLQRSRFFRQNGRLLLTDARWLPRKNGSPLTARAAAVEEPWPDAALEACRALGLRLEAIRPAGTGVETRLDLMPARARAARRLRARICFRWWGIAVAAAWLLLSGMALAKFTREERRVQSRLEILAEPASALRKARQALRAGSETLAAITASERERSKVLERLAAVIESLPDSSHLTTLELDLAGGGSATGAAWRTAEVVESLDASQAVIEPRLVGPATTMIAAGQGWQPFAMEFGPRAQ